MMLQPVHLPGNSTFIHMSITSIHWCMMKIGEKNVGTADRVVRIIAGIALIVAFALQLVAAPLSYLVVIIGLIALVTGAAGTCGLYSLLGISTAGENR